MNKERIICLNCGNKTQFIRKRGYSELVIEKQLIDGEGNMIDTSGEETIHSERDTSIDDEYSCTCCNAEDDKIKFLEKREILEMEYTHRDKLGKWHLEPVPKENRDEKLLEKIFLMDV